MNTDIEKNSIALNALSPLDGRYATKTAPLREYFSEAALIYARVLVEVEYFLALCEEVPQLKSLSEEQKNQIEAIIEKWDIQHALRIKEIEATTNHDVKAVEYFLKEEFEKIGLSDVKEFIHFGLTSQDINNTAFPLMISSALNNFYLPAISDLHEKLMAKAEEWKEIAMLARTHGQPASPTSLGKEISVFTYRLDQEIRQLVNSEIKGKFGGATGNFNAHKAAFPSIDWKTFADNLYIVLGLSREEFTTQISNYDSIAALCHSLCRINTILIDFSRDVWSYISMGYFSQKIKKGEVGSSAMPHKVNPIDFENAEGNLMTANAMLSFLAEKLPISRLQRDLTDSTVLRNIGVPFGYMAIALSSLSKGIDKLLVNEVTIKRDLETNYEVVAEAIQTILRREGYPHPYETLKELTRTGHAMDKETIARFVDELAIPEAVKEEIKAISPHNYTGYNDLP